MKIPHNKKIKIYQGDLFIDDRGCVAAVNDFKFEDIKRFYSVENFNTNTIRAFHGHLKEGKYVFVASGTIILCIVYIDNPLNPAKKTYIERLVLSSKKPRIVYIPPHYANGFKVLEDDTKVIFFSTSSLQESENDDYRYPYDFWGKEIWEIKNR